MAYANANELKRRINRTSGISDDVLEAFLEAATKTIDRFTNRPEGFLAETTATTRELKGSGSGVLRIPDCVEIVSVSVKDSPTDATFTAWTSSDWIAFGGSYEDPDFQPLTRLRPYTGIMVAPNGDYSYFPSGKYTHGPRSRPFVVPMVELEAKYGYAVEVPEDIREACLMQAARFFKQFEGGMTDTLASEDFGTLLYQRDIHPTVKMLLEKGRYIRPAIG